MYPTLAIIITAFISLYGSPIISAQLLSDQKSEGWSQLDLTTSSKGLSNHNSDVSNYIQSDSSTPSSSTRSSGNNVSPDNELPMGFLGGDPQQLFPFDFNAMKHYAEPLFNALNQTFLPEPTGSLYQSSNNVAEHLINNQIDTTDPRSFLRYNGPTNIQLDNFRKRALKALPQIKNIANDYSNTGPFLNWLTPDAPKKIKYHTPLNPFEQLIAANMMAAGNPLLKNLLVKQKRAIEPEYLMSPSNQVTKVLANNYNLPIMSNPSNFYNNELEPPRPMASMKREFPTIYIDSPQSKASRFGDDEAMGVYMDQLYTGTKMSYPYYASYPYSYMGPKYYTATRKVFDKSLITSALVGIGAGIVSFLIISNIFLSLPLFALSLLHLFGGGNNMIINPNNNIQPNNNNNNQPTTTTRPPNQGRKRRSSNYLDELEQKFLDLIKSFGDIN